jgi:hypothetical protein
MKVDIAAAKNFTLVLADIINKVINKNHKNKKAKIYPENVKVRNVETKM